MKSISAPYTPREHVSQEGTSEAWVCGSRTAHWSVKHVAGLVALTLPPPGVSVQGAGGGRHRRALGWLTFGLTLQH